MIKLKDILTEAKSPTVLNASMLNISKKDLQPFVKTINATMGAIAKEYKQKFPKDGTTTIRQGSPYVVLNHKYEKFGKRENKLQIYRNFSIYFGILLCSRFFQDYIIINFKYLKMFFGGAGGFPFDDDEDGFPGMGGPGMRRGPPKEVDNKKLYEVLGVDKDATMGKFSKLCQFR